MKQRNKAWGLGVVLLGAAAACTPSIRDLGDEPIGGAQSGGRGGDDERGGTGAVVPTGGTSSQPQPTAGDGNAGGAAPQSDCFAPRRRLDLARDPNGVGCPCNGAESACVRDDSGEVPWLGQLDCVDGRWKSVTPSCDQECFSPTVRPDLAIDGEVEGCACEPQPPECVLTEHDGRPWRVSFYCDEGQWVVGEDGVCGDGGQADCRVNDVTHAHGGRHIPSPYDCNECECSDGALICTEANCPDDNYACPEGTSLISRCVECRGGEVMSECSVVETGCFTPAECPAGECGVACL